jgi:hypothetical protein
MSPLVASKVGFKSAVAPEAGVSSARTILLAFRKTTSNDVIFRAAPPGVSGNPVATNVPLNEPPSRGPLNPDTKPNVPLIVIISARSGVLTLKAAIMAAIDKRKMPNRLILLLQG